VPKKQKTTHHMIVLVLSDISVDDDRLVRARRGDREAVAQIYISYCDPVYQFVRLRVLTLMKCYSRVLSLLQAHNLVRTGTAGE